MILHVARREWLEQRRQPAMLAAIGSLFFAIGGAADVALLVVDRVLLRPETVALFEELLGAGALTSLVGSIVTASSFLGFSQLLGVGAVLGGHAMLHDRQCGTLTFLLLAPVSRFELLAGKVLGSLGAPLLIYATVTCPLSALAALVPAAAAHPAYLPSSAGWWVAMFVAGPAWTAVVTATTVLVSNVARDVRTAQQLVWFVVFFATLGCGALLTFAMPRGVGVQLANAALATTTLAGILAVGSGLTRRDLGRM